MAHVTLHSFLRSTMYLVSKNIEPLQSSKWLKWTCVAAGGRPVSIRAIFIRCARAEMTLRVVRRSRGGRRRPASQPVLMKITKPKLVYHLESEHMFLGSKYENFENRENLKNMNLKISNKNLQMKKCSKFVQKIFTRRTILSSFQWYPYYSTYVHTFLYKK